MKQIESTGKTIEEALAAGLKELGCTIGDVSWVPLQEGSKGLFGLFGSRPAKVRITLNSDEDEGIDVDILSTLTQDTTLKPEPKPVRPAPSFEEAAAEPALKTAPAPVKAPTAPKSAPAPVKAQAPYRAPATTAFTPEDVILEPVPIPAEPPVQHPADTNMGRAQQFLGQLTQMMGVDVLIYVTEDEDKHLYVRIYGDTLGVLIGRRGETLDAVQYLTSLVVNRECDDYVRVTLDTENYRAKREEALRRLAMRMASRAVKTGRRVVLEPMNPYERRILHSSLQNHPHVTTHSEGEEPNRRIVISLKK